MLIDPLLATLLTLAFAPSGYLTQGEALRFRLLPKDSQIVTQVSDPFGQTVTGEFTLRDGETRGQIQDLKGSGWVRLTIDAASYNSNLGMRDQDVQENYLHVKEHPVITFTSTGIEEIKGPTSPNETWQLTMRGILEIHGVKREIKVPVKLTHRDRKITAEGKAKIALKDFNIAVPTLLFFFRSGDQVEVKFRIVGEQQP